MFNKSRAWTSKLAFLIYYNDYIIMINGSINSHWDIITRDANVSHSQQNFILFTTLTARYHNREPISVVLVPSIRDYVIPEKQLSKCFFSEAHDMQLSKKEWIRSHKKRVVKRFSKSQTYRSTKYQSSISPMSKLHKPGSFFFSQFVIFCKVISIIIFYCFPFTTL